MKIVVGLSNAVTEEEIEAYSESGADEFFLGYIPYEWQAQYGWEICNRRSSPDENYDSPQDLKNVVDIIHKNNKKALLCFNAHEYNLKQVNLILRILKSIDSIPFDAFIISNLALMLQLRKEGIEKTINISIGGGCYDISTILFYKENISNIGRIILPRWLTIQEIENIAKDSKKYDIKLEAFGAAGPCVFNDEYCFTWHSAVSGPFCGSKLYRHKNVTPVLAGKNWKSEIQTDILGEYLQKKNKLTNVLIQDKKNRLKITEEEIEKFDDNKEVLMNEFLLKRNIIRCGLCAFQKFQEYGIEAIKIPIRGSNIAIYGKHNLIKLSKNVIENNNASPEFCQKLLSSPLFCLGSNCYYNYPFGEES
jgi:hypothetical protein